MFHLVRLSCLPPSAQRGGGTHRCVYRACLRKNTGSTTVAAGIKRRCISHCIPYFLLSEFTKYNVTFSKTKIITVCSQPEAPATWRRLYWSCWAASWGRRQHHQLFPEEEPSFNRELAQLSLSSKAEFTFLGKENRHSQKHYILSVSICHMKL